jgi:hypothetical protein
MTPHMDTLRFARARMRLGAVVAVVRHHVGLGARVGAPMLRVGFDVLQLLILLWIFLWLHQFQDM